MRFELTLASDGGEDCLLLAVLSNKEIQARALGVTNEVDGFVALTAYGGKSCQLGVSISKPLPT